MLAPKLILVVLVLSLASCQPAHPAIAPVIFSHPCNCRSDDDADDSLNPDDIAAIQSQLQSLRADIDRFRREHGNAIPNLIKDWTPLTAVTSQNGVSREAIRRDIPTNLLNSQTTVLDGTDAARPAAPVGFVYDYHHGAGSGRIWATDSNGTTILQY